MLSVLSKTKNSFENPASCNIHTIAFSSLIYRYSIY